MSTPHPPAGRPIQSHPDPEPKRFDQILQTPAYRWWRPALGIVLAGIGFFVGQVVLLPILVIEAGRRPGSFEDNLDALASFQVVTPWNLLYLNLSLAASIPVVFVIVWALHGLRPRWLSSVVPRLRWRLLPAFVGVAAVAVVGAYLLALLLPERGGEPDLGRGLQDLTATTIGLALVVVLTTPLQAMGEEYVFRGYLLQALGSLGRWQWWRWAAILISALAFATAHGSQNVPLFFDRFAIGFALAWLCVRTGGLEAAIAFHVLINLVGLLGEILLGDVGALLMIDELPWSAVPVTLTRTGLYVGLSLLVARRLNVQTLTRPSGA
jgi:membrane protease YdiL (CAAX protease family)